VGSSVLERWDWRVEDLLLVGFGAWGLGFGVWGLEVSWSLAVVALSLGLG
jgi:hypothetical protein